MKKAAKVSGSSDGFRPTGDTTESKSINMEKECLVEKTSFDYGKGSALAGGDHNQTPMGSKVKTKKALGKPLGNIDFSPSSDNDDVLLDVSLVLPPPAKNLVNVSILGWTWWLGNLLMKSFWWSEICFQRSMVLGEASTFSKFAEIVNLMKATKLAIDTKILVNTNLKKSSGHSDQAVVLKKIPVETSTEAVCAALSSFGVIVLIKMQLVGLWQKAVIEFSESEQADLVANAVHVARVDQNKESWDSRDQHRALLYTLLIGMTAHNIWDYIGSVDEKTCAIDCYSVMYAWARCAVVCFDSADSLDAVMGTTLVLRGVNMYWSLLDFFKCAKCGKLGHISLGYAVGRNISSGKHPCRSFSDLYKSRLATIYVKHSAPIACPVTFGGVSWMKIAGGNVFPPLSVQKVLFNSGFSSEMKPIIHDTSNVEKKFAVLKSSLTSLAGQINELAKRLDSFMLAVFQFSPGCQLPVTSHHRIRLENMLEELSASVLSLTVRFDGSILAGGASPKSLSQ
ncbi:hypothetical protein G9A89_021573 [Geosiphon pyriformis]|nr:hypothetical protein G9A89_021573 [Geosiphon pyriformis]